MKVLICGTTAPTPALSSGSEGTKSRRRKVRMTFGHRRSSFTRREDARANVNFDVPESRRTILPLLGGEGRGEGER
jgi:hypothetical protein